MDRAEGGSEGNAGSHRRKERVVFLRVLSVSARAGIFRPPFSAKRAGRARGNLGIALEAVAVQEYTISWKLAGN